MTLEGASLLGIINARRKAQEGLVATPESTEDLGEPIHLDGPVYAGEGSGGKPNPKDPGTVLREGLRASGGTGELKMRTSEVGDLNSIETISNNARQLEKDRLKAEQQAKAEQKTAEGQNWFLHRSGD